MQNLSCDEGGSKVREFPSFYRDLGEQDYCGAIVPYTPREKNAIDCQSSARNDDEGLVAIDVGKEIDEIRFYLLPEKCSPRG